MRNNVILANNTAIRGISLSGGKCNLDSVYEKYEMRQ